MVFADESMEMVRKSPTEAVPLYLRTVFWVVFEIEVGVVPQPTRKQPAASNRSHAFFIDTSSLRIKDRHNAAATLGFPAWVGDPGLQPISLGLMQNSSFGP